MREKSWISPLKVLGMLLGAAWVAGLLMGAYFAPVRRAEQPPQMAPLLLQIQSLGQLHTVRYNMHDVVEHEHSLSPGGWLSGIPGAEGLCRAATRNSVLVEADGGVEAGVDLSQVSAASVSRLATPEGAVVRVRLPHALVYPPDVRVRVVRSEPGLFWEDENIVPEATSEARRKMLEAARRANIVASAETNAVRTLEQMQLACGGHAVQFYF